MIFVHPGRISRHFFFKFRFSIYIRKFPCTWRNKCKQSFVLTKNPGQNSQKNGHVICACLLIWCSAVTNKCTLTYTINIPHHYQIIYRLHFSNRKRIVYRNICNNVGSTAEYGYFLVKIHIDHYVPLALVDKNIASLTTNYFHNSKKEGTT